MLAEYSNLLQQQGRLGEHENVTPRLGYIDDAKSVALLSVPWLCLRRASYWVETRVESAQRKSTQMPFGKRKIWLSLNLEHTNFDGVRTSDMLYAHTLLYQPKRSAILDHSGKRQVLR